MDNLPIVNICPQSGTFVTINKSALTNLNYPKSTVYVRIHCWCGASIGSGQCVMTCFEGGHGNPLQYSCLENPHGQRSQAGYSPWGCRFRHNWPTKDTTARDNMYLLLWYHWKYFHCPMILLPSIYSCLPFPQPLVTTNIYIASIVLPFP